MNKNYLVTIKIENDGVKPTKEQYLVNATGTIDAQAKVTEFFQELANFNFEVVSVTETKILEFIK
jgi:hypothetical protein